MWRHLALALALSLAASTAAASSTSSAASSCSKFVKDAGALHGGVRCTKFPDGTHAATQSACCAMCTPSIGCSNWIFVAGAKGTNCWLLSSIAGTQRVVGHNLGGKLPPPPPARGKNLLYVVFDDLRPDLSAYDVPFMHTPNIQKLADSGLTFTRAYVQIAVCSPSRNSFSTGRRPNSTKVWNFINHFRNAACPVTLNSQKAVGTVMAGGWKGNLVGWSQPGSGGHAQCCTSCSSTAGCEGWTYHNNNCTLLSAVSGFEPCPHPHAPLESIDTCVGGRRGAFQQWTPLPQHMKYRVKNNGWLTLGVGKYYHSGGHSAGASVGDPADIAHPAGSGTPPMADRDMSWSNPGGRTGKSQTNGSIQFPDQRPIQAQWGHFHGGEFGPFGNFEYLLPDEEPCRSTNPLSGDYCNPKFAADGTPPSPPEEGQQALADFITYKDAIKKMRYAADNRKKTGQPFFLVAGIKRPHLNWRAPESYLQHYPIEKVAAPTQKVMDKSVPDVAYSVFPMSAPNGTNGSHGNFVTDPRHAGTDLQLRTLRQAYYTTVSWADFAAGQIINELDALGLTNDTMVVLHSDHGWHLGEYAMWEKRTNWELGTRVPLIMRVPWIPGAASGKRSKALVEVVDIYQTVCDVMGVTLPDDTVAFDGTSLKPVLESPETTSDFKPYALSTFPRCAHVGMPQYGARGQKGGADNTCLEVERTDFTWMGYTMRTARWRYTEWVGWNGTSLTPLWGQLKAAELYDHQLDVGAWTDADKYENVNLVTTTPKAVVQALSKQLHGAFGFPDGR